MPFTSDNLQKCENYLASKQFFSESKLPCAEDYDLLADMNQKNLILYFEKHPNLFGWWWTLSPFSAQAKDMWKCGVTVDTSNREGSEKKNQSP